MSDEENTQNTPLRPAGIKPITIKPAMPPPAAVVPPPVSAPPPPSATIPPTPLIKPISITPAAGTGAGTAKPLDAATPTVRLKPTIISPPPVNGAPPSSAAPSIQPPPVAGAAKSKTARISLDAALNETASAGKPAPIGKITSNLTDAALNINREQAKPGMPLGGIDSGVTQRKTLRVKAPGSDPSGPVLTAAGGGGDDSPTVKKKPLTISKPGAKSDGAALPSFAPPEGEQHVGAHAAFQNQKVEKTNPIFPIIAIASCFVILALSLLYMSQACGPDRSMTQFSSFRGWPSIDFPGKLPLPPQSY